MELGKEIKMTKPFRSEQDKAFINVIYTGNVLSEQVAIMLKEYKLNDQHFNILRILKGRYPNCASPGEIKEVLLNKRGDLTRLIEKLVKLNLVRREVNVDNRRKVDVALLPAGLDQLRILEKRIDSAEHQKNNLTEAEAAELNRLLDKLRG